MLDVGMVPGAVNQAAYATLLERGEIDRHLRRTRREYQVRRTVLIRALGDHMPQVSLSGAAAGLHLIAWLPENADEAAVARVAAEQGVAVHPLRGPCSVTAPRPPALLLGYGLIGAAAIPPAIQALGRAAAQQLT